MSDCTEERWHHEYYHLQAIVTGYNGDCLAIKNWSVTVATAAIAFAYVEETPELLLLSAGGTLAFMFTEAYWRANQWIFIKRILEIEQAEDPAQMAAPRISTSWKDHWGMRGRFWRDFVNDFWHVLRSAINVRTLLPHAIIVIAVICLFLFAPPDCITKKTAHSKEIQRYEMPPADSIKPPDESNQESEH